MIIIDIIIGILALILIPLAVRLVDKFYNKFVLYIHGKNKKRVTFTDLPLPHLAIYLAIMIGIISVYHLLVKNLVNGDMIIQSTSNLVGPIVAISSVYLASSIQQFTKSILGK